MVSWLDGYIFLPNGFVFQHKLKQDLIFNPLIAAAAAASGSFWIMSAELTTTRICSEFFA